MVAPAVAEQGVDDETVGEKRECGQQSFGNQCYQLTGLVTRSLLSSVCIHNTTEEQQETGLAVLWFFSFGLTGEVKSRGRPRFETLYCVNDIRWTGGGYCRLMQYLGLLIGSTPVIQPSKST